jgi:hypothetical protein
MATASDGHKQFALSCESHGLDDIGETRATHDQTRLFLDTRVPDPPRCVVFRIVSDNHWPDTRVPKLLNARIRDRRS